MKVQLVGKEILYGTEALELESHDLVADFSSFKRRTQSFGEYNS